MSTILVIDDHSELRQSTLELLQFEGFDTCGAADGLLGLQLARQRRPDLILCDVMMPGLDGFDVLGKLRSDPVTAAIPVIFLTANSDTDVELRAGQLGAAGVLTKPFDTDILLDALRTELQKHSVPA